MSAITLSAGALVLDLPPGLLWPDEFAWRATMQAVTPTLTGALVVETATLQAGRPVTLQSGEDFAWITRADLDQLDAWADTPGQVLSLTLRGAARDVIFRHQDGALDAEAVLHKDDPAAADFYRLTLRLMEI